MHQIQDAVLLLLSRQLAGESSVQHVAELFMLSTRSRSQTYQGEIFLERQAVQAESDTWHDVAALELELAHWARLIVLRSEVLHYIKSHTHCSFDDLQYLLVRQYADIYVSSCTADRK